MTDTVQAEKAITITRVFDASRERVWSAWTDPELFRRWWGPEHFTCPVARIDLRVGGKFVACMRSPEGQDFWSTGVFREIVPPERLVYMDSFADENGNIVPASHYGMDENFPLELKVTVTLDDLDGKTRMTMTHAGIPVGEMKEQTEAGWQTSFDKMAAAVERSHATKWTSLSNREMLIERVFDAPRELVFRAYTDPNLIPRWWGPGYLTTVVEKMDVRPGGNWRYIQRDRDGNEYAFRGEYREVVPPERLVSTFEWEGALGHIAVDSATFEDLDGKTKLSVVSSFDSAEDANAVMQEGAEEGANESYDRLAQVVADLTRERA